MQQKNHSPYIFDFDGTLVNSMYVWAGVYLKLLEDYHISYPPDIVKIVTPLGNRGAASYCVSLGLPMTVDEIIAHNHKILLTEYGQHVQAKSNVLPVLKKLHDAGHSLNILTASPHVYMEPCIKRLGIYELFDNIWSIEDFGLAKNQTEIYVEAARRLEHPVENCIFADDNLVAIETAAKAGMQTIGVYDASSEELTSEIRAAAGQYIRDFAELSIQ